MSGRLRRTSLTVALGTLGVVTVAMGSTHRISMVPVGSIASGSEPLKVRLDSGKSAVTPLVVEGIMPGDEYAKRFRIDGPEGLAFTLSLRTTNIVDHENACSPSEQLVDPSCGSADDGELSASTMLAVLATIVPQGAVCDSPAAPPTRLVGRTLEELDVEVPAQNLVVGSHQDACVEVRLALPIGSGDETQGDSTTYDLVWRAEGLHKVT
jgi:hypothetical protein